MVDINIWNDFEEKSKKENDKKMEYICNLLFNNVNFYSFISQYYSQMGNKSFFKFLHNLNPCNKFEIDDHRLKKYLISINNDETLAKIFIKTTNSIYCSLNRVEEGKECNISYLKNNSSYDLATCKICGELDNVLIPTDIAIVGINIAPFHFGCRCVATSIFTVRDDLETVMQVRNDPINLTKIEMPENSSYTDWKNLLISIHGKKAFEFHQEMRNHNIYDYSDEDFLEFYKMNNGQNLDISDFNYFQLELLANKIYFKNNKKYIEILKRASKLAFPKKAAEFNRLIGERYLSLEEYDTAKSYFEEALRLDEKVGVKRILRRLSKMEGQMK